MLFSLRLLPVCSGLKVCVGNRAGFYGVANFWVCLSFNVQRFVALG
jgi:hypothetical protein